MKICEFCLHEVSKYRCPKCLKEYCSVGCYKCKDHLECSETFYQDCFMEAMREEDLMRKESFDVSKMSQKLKEVDDTALDEELEKLFQSLSLGAESEELWQLLNKQQKTAFLSMHSSRNFSSLLPAWTPWWSTPMPRLVDDQNEFSSLLKRLPKMFKPASLNTLIHQKSPSRSLPFDVLNTIYGYCYVCRLHHGDPEDLLLDSVSTLLSISSSLLSQSFDSVSSSINHCLLALSSDQVASENFVSTRFSLAVIEDLLSVLRGSSAFHPHLFLKAALSHMRSLFRKTIKVVKSEAVDSQLEASKRFLKAGKKVEFYLSWLEAEKEGMFTVVGEVEMLLHTNLTELKEHGVTKDLVEKNLDHLRSKPDKTLVEEI